MREAMGPDLFDACERMGADAEVIIRYAPLADNFKQARARLNLTIKDVAAQLKVPQYKIKAVEKREFRQIDETVFQKYCGFLQLGDYVESWSQWNSALASQLGIRGWSDRQETGDVFQFKITLKDTKPPVWRRIQVPATYSFWDLHVAIQDAMGWLDYHLHQFDIRDASKQEIEHIGIPDDEFYLEPQVLAGWEVPIVSLFTEVKQKARYLYDFGDDWEHTILLEKILPQEGGASYPHCIGGRRKCPPEDCGGTDGYRDFLRIITDPLDEEHESTLEWVGGAYDPDDFVARKVNFDDPAARFRYAFEDEE